MNLHGLMEAASALTKSGRPPPLHRGFATSPALRTILSRHRVNRQREGSRS